MPKPSLQATTTTTVTTSLGLSPRAIAMLKERGEENARLQKIIKDAKARQGRLGKEVEELFVKEGQDEALTAGADVDGFKFKRVTGTTSKLNKVALCRAVEISMDELDAFYDKKPKKAYVRIAAPGERDEEGDE